jgi:hypothetical protein
MILNLLISLAVYYRLESPTLIPGGKVASGKSLLYGLVIISVSLSGLGSVKILYSDLTSIILCSKVYLNTT